MPILIIDFHFSSLLKFESMDVLPFLFKLYDLKIHQILFKFISSLQTNSTVNEYQIFGLNFNLNKNFPA